MEKTKAERNLAADSHADVVARVFAVIESRRGGDASESYVAGLLEKGTAAIARKVGEEAVETIVAALEGGPDRLNRVASESADLLFHLMVLWADQGLRPADIFQELARREGTSGVEEKRQRGQ